MTDHRSEATIGGRIKAARRARGFRTTRELADAIPGGNVTAAVLENIESGRKADIGVSQLLNIARGLCIPPSYLLAPIGTPEAAVDLPNLSDDLRRMTVAEFDCWLSATPASSYRPERMEERTDIEALAILREFGTLRRELERLQIVLDIRSTSGDSDLDGSDSEFISRMKRLRAEAERLANFLATAGIVGLRSETSAPQLEKRQEHG
jgi:transcriptional regulator with XRE-family HTH domain